MNWKVRTLITLPLSGIATPLVIFGALAIPAFPASPWTLRALILICVAISAWASRSWPRIAGWLSVGFLLLALPLLGPGAPLRPWKSYVVGLVTLALSVGLAYLAYRLKNQRTP